jgi:hypothetical protein
MHSVIICVVFSGAYMRCTRLCSLKPGCYTLSSPPSRTTFTLVMSIKIKKKHAQEKRMLCCLSVLQSEVSLY